MRVLWPDGDGDALGSLLEGFGDGDMAMRKEFQEGRGRGSAGQGRGGKNVRVRTDGRLYRERAVVLGGAEQLTGSHESNDK